MVVKLWPTLGEMNYLFTAWSLPKPPANESGTSLIRYGRTGKYQMSKFNNTLLVRYVR